MKIPIKYVIEIGLLRKRNKCANCMKEVKNIPNHNIQLCRNCRLVEFEKFIEISNTKEELGEEE